MLTATCRGLDEHTAEVRQAIRPTDGARRKSVTFAPDTKADDGFSAQELIKEWTSDEQPSPADTAPEQASPATDKASKKEKKRTKQQQSASASDEPHATQEGKLARTPETKEPPEYVRYLEQYYTDKPNWKFHKNKQNDVLKNLFNVYRIPPEHDQALVSYIAGLQGAAAQRRVIEDAEVIFKELLKKQDATAEIDGMESLHARKAAYEAALQREIAKIKRSGAGRSEYDEQQLQEIRREVERAKRAEAVLSELLSKELAPVQPPQVAAATQRSHIVFPDSDLSTNGKVADASVTKPNAKRRKRKARTEVSSDESSSSSSSSESEGE